jgi:hypothetical protein
VDNISFDKLLTDILKPMKKMDLQTWQNPLNKSIILLRGSTSAARSGEVMLNDLQGKEILHTKWQSGEEKLEIGLPQVAGKDLILRYLDGLQAETRLITRPE